MILQPKRPPGRADRKAAAYAIEIVRLRTEGYTYEAIREALADVGISLSECALRREVRRQARQPADAIPEPRQSAPIPAGQAPSVADSPATGPPPMSQVAGRKGAEAFFDANPSNPLIPIKERS